jgi:hypothetical protein
MTHPILAVIAIGGLLYSFSSICPRASRWLERLCYGVLASPPPVHSSDRQWTGGSSTRKPLEGSMTNAGRDIFLHSTKVVLEHERPLQEVF